MIDHLVLVIEPSGAHSFRENAVLKIMVEEGKLDKLKFAAFLQNAELGEMFRLGGFIFVKITVYNPDF